VSELTNFFSVAATTQSFRCQLMEHTELRYSWLKGRSMSLESNGTQKHIVVILGRYGKVYRRVFIRAQHTCV
jgi:hypothetical protein